MTVGDGETLSLGDKTLKFIHTPWVHWAETMVTYLEEDRILFSCDFFGSHIATADLFVTDKGRVYEAAKRYFAEIMMPFRNVIEKKAKFLSIIGSYGWGGKTVETLAGMIPNLKVEVLDPVLCKGLPSESDLKALDTLAETIAKKHENLGIKSATAPSVVYQK